MSNDIDWITQIAPITAFITSVIAVFIAAKSANAADKSADLAEKAIHRSARGELLAGARELIEEEQRIKSLLIDLNSELTSLSRFSGSYLNSGTELIKQNFEKDSLSASERTIDAKALVSAPEKLINASTNDIDFKIVKIDTNRSELRTIRESMIRELEHLRSQNLQHREQAINSPLSKLMKNGNS